jgi:hypothetical protein
MGKVHKIWKIWKLAHYIKYKNVHNTETPLEKNIDFYGTPYVPKHTLHKPCHSNVSFNC